MFEMLGRTHTPSQAAISPDGATVAWSVGNRAGEEIHLTNMPDADPVTEQIVTTGATNCSNSAPLWSPDGESLAFESSCTRQEGAQIYIWSKKLGTSKQLTHLTGAINDLAWSPDGQSIAFLFVDHATRTAGALAPMKPWSGIVGEDGVEVQRVAAVSTTLGAFDYLTPPNLHVYEFSWSSDSGHIAFVAADPPGENNWWVAQLYTREVYPSWLPTGRPCPTDRDCLNLKSIFDPAKTSGPLHGLQIAVPRWSPDGKQIAFIGGLMSDQGITGGDIYLMPSTVGQPKDITPNRTASPVWFAWIDNRTLKISEHAGGGMHLVDYNLATASDAATLNMTLPESIGSGALSSSVSFSRSGDMAFIRSSFDRAPEVWAGPPQNLRQITHLNTDLKPVWGKTENVEWTNEGFHIQGWLLYPGNYDPSQKYPLIVFIHGGPSNKTTPRWPTVAFGGIPFSGLGYFVFMPNPRGSYGQGEKFTQANIKDFGYGDLRDVLTGLDVIEKRFPIDKAREGLTGWSYGGFLTMFGVTQTNRFRAAVAGAGISNYQSYYGENSIDQWLVPFFDATVYDDPAVYAKSSPINFIKNVKTATLVVVGDRDGECPAPQSFEFWHALRAQGVKTQLVVYPNEGQSFQNPVHRQDVLERALDWFQTQMPAK